MPILVQTCSVSPAEKSFLCTHVVLFCWQHGISSCGYAATDRIRWINASSFPLSITINNVHRSYTYTILSCLQVYKENFFIKAYSQFWLWYILPEYQQFVLPPGVYLFSFASVVLGFKSLPICIFNFWVTTSAKYLRRFSVSFKINCLCACTACCTQMFLSL